MRDATIMPDDAANLAWRLIKSGCISDRLRTGLTTQRVRSLEMKLVFRGALVAWALLAGTACARADTLADLTIGHVDRLRTIEATNDAKAIESFNEQMDEAWRFFMANKPSALPVLRQVLSDEVNRGKPNNMVLLDIGTFLAGQGSEQDKVLARSALFALDPAAPIVKQNEKELFEFTHGVAAERDPRALTFIDKAFLDDKAEVFIPQHALRLDDTLICVFLYGVYGDGAEEHLRGQLQNPLHRHKVLEILGWIGSPSSVADVKAADAAAPDFDTFVRVTAFMMKTGGPEGRTAMLEFRPDSLDPRSREYFAKVRPAIVAQNYRAIRQQVGPSNANRKISDDVVRERLVAMKANFGKDETTEPASILDSGLPRDELIRTLTEIRARTFHRLSDEALSDVEITNALINALRYRDH
jgi:hypothetical protein